MKKIDKSERIGQVFSHPKYGKFEVIDYQNCEQVTIKFVRTGYTQTTSYNHICNLEVFDALHTGIYGNKKGGSIRNTPSYKCWYNMIHRVHNTNAYKDVSICTEWYDFSQFEKWYSAQYKEQGWHLDKDLKRKGNKEYNPHSCCFLPPQINTFISKFSHCKGYSYNKRRHRYEAYCREDGKYIHLGLFDKEDDARNAYLTHKIKVANILIDRYKDVLDETIKSAIINHIKV